ncbi:unnamed protein product [Soboliphyme baturini]|uniref:Zinc finger CCCH domain-containing protein 6 n=1 Tax=Soboliphyme baturini TaxID=241478 RepID=A0A183I967_9BILA|nr:unnamed protein product [Soboliphyme baturini]
MASTTAKVKSPSPTASYLKKPDNKVPSSSKYLDLDRIEDPNEAMISNWAKGIKRCTDKPKKRAMPGQNAPSPSHSSGSLSFDPYDDYYGRGSPTPPNSEDAGKDQDYRVGAANDQDYRLVGPYDMDYRRKSAGEILELNPEESSELGPDEDMSNEFGDIDERPRTAGAGTLSRKATISAGGKFSAPKNEPGCTDRRSKRAHSNESVSDGDINHFADGSVDRPQTDNKGRMKGGRVAKGNNKRSKSPMGTLKRRRFRWDRGERPACKFFKEGYCREGETCAFSHDIDMPKTIADKKPELCKYYAQGFCRNGRRCSFLHGEFPCKFFYKNACSKGSQCRYSHEKLSDVTKPLYDKMLKDEEMASKVGVPDAPSRRKVLLGEPPKNAIQGPHLNGPAGPHFDKPAYAPLISQEPPDVLYYGSSDKSVNLKCPAEGSALQSTLRSFPEVLLPSDFNHPLGNAMKQDEKRDAGGASFDSVSIGSTDNSSISFDITAMLRQIKAQMNGDKATGNCSSFDSRFF